MINLQKEKKTTKTYKQNSVCKGYHITSEINVALQSGFFESPLIYDNNDWFVLENMKL